VSDVDSRYLGNEIRLRPLRDASNNTVVIADPLQTALADGVVDAWQMYSTAVSLYHAVYLQVPAPLLPLSSTPNLITAILSNINSLSANYPVSSRCRTLLLVPSLKLPSPVI